MMNEIESGLVVGENVNPEINALGMVLGVAGIMREPAGKQGNDSRGKGKQFSIDAIEVLAGKCDENFIKIVRVAVFLTPRQKGTGGILDGFAVAPLNGADGFLPHGARQIIFVR